MLTHEYDRKLYDRKILEYLDAWGYAQDCYSDFEKKLPVEAPFSYEWGMHYDDDDIAVLQESIFEKFRAWKNRIDDERFKRNLLIKVRTRQDPVRQSCSPQELQARLLLRDLLSEREWRRYVTNGFLMVRGSSGKWYQIFADQRQTVVYDKGNRTHTLCIHTTKECPPTDHIINLKTMIEIEESLIWKGANVRLVA